ncbi:MAG: S8 family serine peptidase [Kiritimatiellae bacterium]|nr:S8 family serine peptidase [Kiritimatiellia bacterium]
MKKAVHTVLLATALPLAVSAATPLLLPGGAKTLAPGSTEETRKSLVAVGKSLAEDTSTDVWIVQYDPEKTMASAIRNLVSSVGAQLLSPVAGGAYLVRATKAQQLAILESGQIEATRQYDPSDKCAPINDSGLAKGFALGGASSGDAVFVVSAFDGADNAALREQVAALKGCEVLDGGEGILRVRMTAAGRAAAAALPEVASIGEWIEPRLINDVAVQAMHVNSIWPSRQAPAQTDKAVSNVRDAAPESRRVTAVDFFSKGLLTADGFDASEPKVARNAPRQSEAKETIAAVESASSATTTSLGLTGKGQIVAVCDTGLDTGNLSTLHPDVRGRIVKTFAYGRPAEKQNWTGDWSDESGHGTHVAGSVLGNGAASGGKYTGPAYEARIVFQSHGSKQFWVEDKNGNRRLTTKITGFGNLASIGVNPYSAVLVHAYQSTDQDGNSPKIHSNSWGGNAEGEYADSSRSFDLVSFFLPDFLTVVAAGNEGVDHKPPYGVIDPGSMGSPATAKNCLTVGAAENYRNNGGYSEKVWSFGSWEEDFPNNPIAQDFISRPQSGSQGMAAFSSRGPCLDGRVKPDVVAPGTDILSVRSRAKPQIPSSWGPFDEFYHFCGGTSMACPLVAGTAALVRQWLVERKGVANPDAATMKAILCAGAKSLAPGQYGTGQYREIPAVWEGDDPKKYPNNVEGWGMVDLENSVANPDGVAFRDGQIISEGESLTFRVKVPGGRPLCILMAYSDAPATSFSGGLINDIDLTVTDPSGKLWFPNCNDGPDRVNNVEGVRWDSAPAGEYIATVRAASIQSPMDQKLTNGRENAARFSLVANGAREIL